MRAQTLKHKQAFADYMAAYIREEIARAQEVDENTILNGIEAFEGGAHGLDEDLILSIERA